MIAVFFKNLKAEPEVDASVLAAGESALHERMQHMLRQQAKLALYRQPVHFEPPKAVKKPVSIRKQLFAIQ